MNEYVARAITLDVTKPMAGKHTKDETVERILTLLQEL